MHPILKTIEFIDFQLKHLRGKAALNFDLITRLMKDQYDLEKRIQKLEEGKDKQ